MEVKPGYKQTEVGVIPEQWEVVPIGELFTFKNGLNKAKKFFGHGTPIVNYMDVYGRPALRLEHIGGRVDVSVKELSAYSVRKGDVFFTRTSETVEEIGTASVMLDNPESAVYSGFVLRARPTNGSLADAFKAYCFSPRYLRQQITALASYTTRALTNGRSLSAALLARPPLPEQRAIATALSDVDALLGGLDRLIAKKRDLKQAAMQQLLTGQTRLPGFHGEWEVKALRDSVSTPITDGPHLTPKFLAEGVPFLSVNNLVNNRLDLRSLRFVSREDHLEFSKKCTPRRGDILFGKAASVGMVALIDTDMELNIWSPLALIRVGHLASEIFVFYALQTSHIHRQIKLLTNSSSQGNIGMSDIGLLEVPFPKRDEQTAIAAVLSDMDAELSALVARRDKTRDLKQAMMQELLTGKTRLIPTGGAHA